ncbi:MAG: DUF432 domain-containing protein [Zestosphaera sp.]
MSDVRYGRFELSDTTLNLGGVRVSVIRDGRVVRYVREGGGVVERVIVPSSRSYIVVNPVEPTNLPKPVSDFILIEFSRPLLIAPESSITAYTTFPVEVGVFLVDVKDSNVIDVFSLVRQKYTLYGTPRSGVICRYWASGVSTEVPTPNPLMEGVLKLRILNSSGNWVTVSNVVLSVDGMSIYYDHEHVSSAAQLNIISPSLAETSALEEPLNEGMGRSITIRSQRRAPMIKGKFVMEWGL